MLFFSYCTFCFCYCILCIQSFYYKFVEDLAKKEGLDIRKWIMEGQPAKEILKLAEEQSIDLILMGTLGRSGIEKFLLGSVADKVIRGSRIPVLTVRK